MNPADVTVVVIAVGEPPLPYLPYTVPFIEDYCRRCGYRLVIVRENIVDTGEGLHPAWNKLLISEIVTEGHAIAWDADLVPLPHAPPIHEELSNDLLAMVKIIPTRTGRMRLRRAYGRRACPHLFYNSGLISIPQAMSGFLRETFNSTDRLNSVFWDQGAINHAIYQNNIPIQELDSKWNWWVQTRLTGGVLEEAMKANCLHFARGSSRRLRNTRRLHSLFYPEA